MGWLKYLLLFLLFFIIGFSVRFLFFGLYQIPEGKEYFQELPLIQDQGGSETPELAWQNYLNALKNNDIESALQQVWPYERGKMEERLFELANEEYLSLYVDSFSIDAIKPINDFVYEAVGKRYLSEEYQKIILGYVPFESGSKSINIKIKLNPHNQRWYISFFGDQF